MRKKKATCPAGTAVARNSANKPYPHHASVSRLQQLLTSLLLMTENPNLDAIDRTSAWSIFERLLRKYIEVRHGL